MGCARRAVANAKLETHPAKTEKATEMHTEESRSKRRTRHVELINENTYPTRTELRDVRGNRDGDSDVGNRQRATLSGFEA